MMETGTFLKEKVQEYVMKRFIPVKYESGRDAEQFLRFGVRLTPSFVFLNSNGDEIYRTVGFFSAGDFIKQLEQARQHTQH
jgi:thioredoxin-related protein